PVVEKLKKLEAISAVVGNIDVNVEKVCSGVGNLQVKVDQIGGVCIESREELRVVRQNNVVGENILQELASLKAVVQTQGTRLNEVVSLVHAENGMRWVDKSNFEIDLGNLEGLLERCESSGATLPKSRFGI